MATEGTGLCDRVFTNVRESMAGTVTAIEAIRGTPTVLTLTHVSALIRLMLRFPQGTAVGHLQHYRNNNEDWFSLWLFAGLNKYWGPHPVDSITTTLPPTGHILQQELHATRRRPEEARRR
ncbi:unnamed protein product [Nezara viridula]|uniref:Uncharacterized protein n=1 Tax=Nezara viridula TaxID=85310 RepID=A0A9P0H2D8_NEZVI|nr:unnamed protein product [Nezara viridula]